MVNGHQIINPIFLFQKAMTTFCHFGHRKYSTGRNRFKHGWNQIYECFIEFKIHKHIGLYKRHSIYDKEKTEIYAKIVYFLKGI